MEIYNFSLYLLKKRFQSFILFKLLFQKWSFLLFNIIYLL